MQRTGTTGWLTAPSGIQGGRAAFQTAVSDVIRQQGIVVPPLRIVDVRDAGDVTLPEDVADVLLCANGILPADILSAPPCWVVVEMPSDAPSAVVAGAAGLVVPASVVAETKEILRDAAAHE